MIRTPKRKVGLQMIDDTTCIVVQWFGMSISAIMCFLIVLYWDYTEHCLTIILTGTIYYWVLLLWVVLLVIVGITGIVGQYYWYYGTCM